jgi:hypothetical protein
MAIQSFLSPPPKEPLPKPISELMDLYSSGVGEVGWPGPLSASRLPDLPSYDHDIEKILSKNGLEPSLDFYQIMARGVRNLHLLDISDDYSSCPASEGLGHTVLNRILYLKEQNRQIVVEPFYSEYDILQAATTRIAKGLYDKDSLSYIEPKCFKECSKVAGSLMVLADFLISSTFEDPADIRSDLNN